MGSNMITLSPGPLRRRSRQRLPSFATGAWPRYDRTWRASLVLAAMLIATLPLSAVSQETLSRQEWQNICSTRSASNVNWRIYFEAHSSVLARRAELILGELADEWSRNGGIVLGIRAYVDGSETTDADQQLALRRGEAARQFLIGKGISAASIWLDTTDQHRMQVETSPGVAEPQNRLVILTPVGLGYRHTWQQRRNCLNWFQARCQNRVIEEREVALCNEALHFIVPNLYY